MSVSVIYHGGCADGMGAAFAVWYHIRELQEQGSFLHARYFPGYYGKPIPKEAFEANKIYVVDFSFPRDEMIALKAKHDIVVIDHHESAQRNLEGLDNCIFDMSQSGAMLTWNYFAALRKDEERVPALFRYIQDRDLWKNELKYTTEINNVIFTLPTDASNPDKKEVDMIFGQWLKLMVDIGSSFKFSNVVAQGEILEVSHRKYIENIKKLAMMRKIILKDGTEIELPVVNAHYTNISTILNELSETSESKLAMSWYVDEMGTYKYSIRGAHDCKINLSKLINEIYGPIISKGGHPKSAGFVALSPIHF